MTNNNVESLRVVRDEREELNFFRHDLLSLRRNSQIDEQWIGDKIEEDPSLIGLGEEVEVIKRERRQPHGRLDFLMQDEDEKIRYALELQLGSADPSHIVRAVNYWNHERKRHPDYEHFPVLVAEDISEQYLEFISTINVPMIVYKLLPIRIEDKVSLVFSKILDMRDPLMNDRENDSTEETDRSYWERKGVPETIDILDNLYKVVKQIDPVFELKYNKFHIGLRKRNGSVYNFVAFKPKKKFLKLEVRKVERNQKLEQELDEKDLDWFYSDRYMHYAFKIKPKHMKNHYDTIVKFIKHSHNVWFDNN